MPVPLEIYILQSTIDRNYSNAVIHAPPLYVCVWEREGGGAKNYLFLAGYRVLAQNDGCTAFFFNPLALYFSQAGIHKVGLPSALFPFSHSRSPYLGFFLSHLICQYARPSLRLSTNTEWCIAHQRLAPSAHIPLFRGRPAQYNSSLSFAPHRAIWAISDAQRVNTRTKWK